MEFKHSIGNKEFTVLCDKQVILEAINREKKAFAPDTYQRRYTVGYEDGYLTEEDYQKNLDAVIEKLEEFTSDAFITEAIEKAAKKKNGWLHKGRVYKTFGCDNTEFITEWHNTWIYNELAVIATSDSELAIKYCQKTDTPG